MKRTFALLLIAASAFGNSYDSTLTEASRLLKKTKNVSSPMVSSLRGVITAKDASDFQKYFAAHLIASSDTCTSKEIQVVCPEVEFLFKNRIEVGKQLGKKAAFGAARVRGDFYFDKGKFDPAAESYDFLTWAPGGQHEYAVLKLGWSYLNKKEAEKAFVLWTQDLAATLKTNETPSRNLVLGLGQSFSENLSRSHSDVQAVNALKFSADDREALTEGLLDGLYFLTTPAFKADWAKSVSQLAIYPELVRHMLVSRINTLLPNCDYLGMLNDKKVFAVMPPSKEIRPVINQCVTLYKKNGDKALLENLIAIYDNSDLKDADPFFAFAFYTEVAKNSSKACQVGVYWAFHETNSQKVALKDIAASCKAGLNTEATLSSLISQTNTLVKANRKALEQADTSAMVLMALLVDEPAIHSSLLRAVNQAPLDYNPTLLPTLLAEQLARLKQWKAVTELKQTVGIPAQMAKKPAIWATSERALLVEKIQKKDFAKTMDLITELKLNDSLNEKNLGVLLEWCRVFYNDQKAEVNAMVTRLSAGLHQAPSVEQYQVLIELLLTQRNDKEVSILFEKFGIPAAFKMHPAFEAQLFDRVLEKSVVVSLSKVKSDQYKKLIFLAQALSQNAKLSPSHFDIKGNTPLHEEFSLVKKVYTKSAGGKNEKLVSLDKISRWVDFLQTVSAVSKRKWISYHLLQQAISQSTETLNFVSANLPKLTPDKDVSAEEWAKIVATLNEKVSDSKDLLNDLSAKAKQTVERQAP